jgi:MerR family transcriptional regulator, redox-sensitive transcriptional activator SoxR
MKIGELAAQADLAPSAIRYYEKVGLLAPADRINGQRRYSSTALDRVLLIRFAGEMDFTLAEIKLFLNGFRENTPVSARWRKLTTRKIAEMQQRLSLTRRLVTLLARLQRCRCVQLHQCVTGLALSPRLRALRDARKAQLSPHAKSPRLESWDDLLGVANTVQTPADFLRTRDRPMSASCRTPAHQFGCR